jgi:hypothetical protein
MKSMVAIYDLSGGYPSGNTAYDRLYTKLQEIQVSQEAAIDSVNEKNQEVMELRDKLLRLSEVIR